MGKNDGKDWGRCGALFEFSSCDVRDFCGVGLWTVMYCREFWATGDNREVLVIVLNFPISL